MYRTIEQIVSSVCHALKISQHEFYTGRSTLANTDARCIAFHLCDISGFVTPYEVCDRCGLYKTQVFFHRKRYANMVQTDREFNLKVAAVKNGLTYQPTIHKPKKYKPVRLANEPARVFSTVKAAAHELKTTPVAIYSRIKRGIMVYA